MEKIKDKMLRERSPDRGGGSPKGVSMTLVVLKADFEVRKSILMYR
jgi:hypothetical protein